MSDLLAGILSMELDTMELDDVVKAPGAVLSLVVTVPLILGIVVCYFTGWLSEWVRR